MPYTAEKLPLSCLPSNHFQYFFGSYIPAPEAYYSFYFCPIHYQWIYWSDTAVHSILPDRKPQLFLHLQAALWYFRSVPRIPGNQPGASEQHPCFFCIKNSLSDHCFMDRPHKLKQLLFMIFAH
jgi:hypothetical protein